MEPKENNLNAKHCLVPCPLLLNHELPHIAKLMYGVIFYQYTLGHEQISISNEEVAKIFSVSLPTVKNGFKYLKSANLIETELEGRHRVIKLVTQDWDFTSWQNVVDEMVSLEESRKNSYADPKEYPSEVIELIRHWNAKKRLAQVSMPVCFGGTKYEATPMFDQTAEAIRQILDGTFFNSMKSYKEHHNRKWSKDEVKKAIDHFEIAVTDPDYYPIRKDRLKDRKLKQFFYADYIQNPEYRSAFLQNLEPPKRLKFIREKMKVPTFTYVLENELVKTFFGGREDAINTHDKNKIIRAANLLSKRLDEWQHYFNMKPSSYLLAGYVCEIIEFMGEDWKSDPVTVITNEWFWDKHYPAYLVKKGIMFDSPASESMYDND